MLVSKVLETGRGTVKFEGELEASELDFVLKVGLNTLLEWGAIPFTSKKEESSIAPVETPLQQ
jgi:hypothetical protein